MRQIAEKAAGASSGTKQENGGAFTPVPAKNVSKQMRGAPAGATKEKIGPKNAEPELSLEEACFKWLYFWPLPTSPRHLQGVTGRHRHRPPLNEVTEAMQRLAERGLIVVAHQRELPEDTTWTVSAATRDKLSATAAPNAKGQEPRYAPEESALVRESLQTALRLSASLSRRDRGRFQHGLILLGCSLDGPAEEELEDFECAHRAEFDSDHSYLEEAPSAAAPPESKERPRPSLVPKHLEAALICFVEIYEKGANGTYEDATALFHGLRDLIEPHPELRPYRDALSGIVQGEELLNKLYSQVRREL